MPTCIECGFEINPEEQTDVINGNVVHMTGCRSRYIRRLDDASTELQEENFLLNE